MHVCRPLDHRRNAMSHHRPSHRFGPALPLALALVLAGAPLLADEHTAPDEPLQAGTRSISVHSLLALDIVTADEESLGQAYDLVADPTDGRLTFLVVERGGNILGLGQTRAAIPWHRVAIDGEARRFVLAMTLEEVEVMPAWEGERAEGAGLGAAPMTE
jgi:sporulation protein YlmC with PRC-barrel domain